MKPLSILLVVLATISTLGFVNALPGALSAAYTLSGQGNSVNSSAITKKTLGASMVHSIDSTTDPAISGLSSSIALSFPTYGLNSLVSSLTKTIDNSVPFMSTSVPDTNSKIPSNSVNYKVLSTAVSSIKKILPGIEPPANYHLLASSGFRNLTSVVTSPGVATSALNVSVVSQSTIVKLSTSIQSGFPTTLIPITAVNSTTQRISVPGTLSIPVILPTSLSSVHDKTGQTVLISTPGAATTLTQGLPLATLTLSTITQSLTSTVTQLISLNPSYKLVSTPCTGGVSTMTVTVIGTPISTVSSVPISNTAVSSIRPCLPPFSGFIGVTVPVGSEINETGGACSSTASFATSQNASAVTTSILTSTTLTSVVTSGNVGTVSLPSATSTSPLSTGAVGSTKVNLAFLVAFVALAFLV